MSPTDTAMVHPEDLRVVLSVPGKFHSFDLARQLHRRRALGAIFTSYPRFKLQAEGLPARKIGTFPYLHAPYMAALKHGWTFTPTLLREWELLTKRSFDAYVQRKLRPCDVFVALSGSGLNSARAAQRLGAKYVCDRGSTHIRTQDRLLREEHSRWGLPYSAIDPRVVEREETEYALADMVTVPSRFTRQTFIDQGHDAARIQALPYGVDLSRFHPSGQPAANRFDVLFVGGMSLRKGLPYLLQAFAKLQHPAKSLTLAGGVSTELMAQLRERGLSFEGVRVLGHVPQPQLKALMSRSHVLVLLSIEEGLALVQAQAMACGCVVVASRHTGAEDLFTDGEEGYIVPVREVDPVVQRLQQLADDPAQRLAMSARALQRVQLLGGWDAYGDKSYALYGSLAGQAG